MDFHFSRSQVFDETPEKLFQIAVLNPDFLIHAVKDIGPLPAVSRVELIGGNKIRVGIIRRVHLSNGGFLNEEITALEEGPVWVLRYRQLTGFPFPLSLFSRSAQGEYRCESISGKSKFTWEATHTLTTPAVLPLVYFLRLLFVHPMMKNFIKAIGPE